MKTGNQGQVNGQAQVCPHRAATPLVPNLPFCAGKQLGEKRRPMPHDLE